MFNEVFFRNFSNVQYSLNLFEGCNIQAKMSCSKFQLSARMKRKNLSLGEKMKIIDYANKNPKMGCRVIAEHFSVGKTCVSDILRNAKTLRGEYEFFKGNGKKLRHGQHHLINEILIAWYKNCASANVFPGGPMLKEEAMLIKESLNKDELATFTASNGWFLNKHTNYVRRGLLVKRTIYQQWPFNHELNVCQN